MRYIQTKILTVLGFVVCLRVALRYIPDLSWPNHLKVRNREKNIKAIPQVGSFNEDVHRRDSVVMHRHHMGKHVQDDNSETELSAREMNGQKAWVADDERTVDSGIKVSGKDHWPGKKKILTVNRSPPNHFSNHCLFHAQVQ